MTARRHVQPSASAADAGRRARGPATSAIAPGAAGAETEAANAPAPPLDIAAWLGLVAWIVGTVAVGAGAGLLGRPDEWYEALAKPTWHPPAWLFAPVWLALYATIGVAAWLVSRAREAPRGERRLAWTAFALQALLNLAWTPLFFGLHSPGWAFLDICLLWIAVLVTTLVFGRLRPPAGYLLGPYVLWVSFALVLNGTIWLMN